MNSRKDNLMEKLLNKPMGVSAKNAAKKLLKKYGVAVAVIVFLAVWTTTATAIVAKRTEKETTDKLNTYWSKYYEEQLNAYKSEVEAQKMSEWDAEQRKADAELIAKVLYGVKGNSDKDLRTYTWCIFNRVDNRLYPNTLQDVIAQPKQWMAYSADNAVLEKLYKIAEEELTKWYTGHRPVTSDYVYMNWTPQEITLRDRWEEGSGTHYWRAEA